MFWKVSIKERRASCCACTLQAFEWKIYLCTPGMLDHLTVYNSVLIALTSQTESIFRRTAGAWWRALRARGSHFRGRCRAGTADRRRWCSTVVWRRRRNMSDSCRTVDRTQGCSDETTARERLAGIQFDDHGAPSDNGPADERRIFKRRVATS